VVVLKSIISLAVFLITILLINQIIDLFTSRERKAKKRLTETLNYPGGPDQEKYHLLLSQKSGKVTKTSPWLERLTNSKFMQKEKSLLEQSGVPIKIEEYLSICLLSGVFIIFISFMIFKNVFPAIALGLLGGFFPGLWIRLAKKRKAARMEVQLLNAVILLGNSLRSGQSFMQALDVVQRETPVPLGEEFHRIIRETTMGVRIEEALRNFSIRMDSREIDLLVTGILVQREVGGNLGEILDIIADTIDKRIKMRKKIQALTSQGRLSGWIVSLLPVALIMLIYIPNPDYAQVMLNSPLGRVMLGAGFVMIIIGSMIIKKVVNIDA
jgi:tight adherence protein B